MNPERQQSYGTNLRALDCKYLLWMEEHLSIDSDRPSEEQPSVSEEAEVIAGVQVRDTGNRTLSASQG